MRVLVACEFSGRVRDAFLSLGHEAISCDLLPTDSPGPHFQGDIFDFLRSDKDFDILIAHPPCTHLCSSGARWWGQKKTEQMDAIKFVQALWNMDIPRICVENPVGILPRFIGPATQIIQPWQFGEGEVKTTCLWLKGLHRLIPTDIVDGRKQSCWRMSEKNDDPRWRRRSLTYKGIAAAMALQWGGKKEE